MNGTIAKQKQKAFNRFLDLPNRQAQSSGKPPTDKAPHFAFRLIRENPTGKPDLNDLNAVVYLSQNNKRIRRANPDMTPETRFGLYALWHAANRNCVMLLERIPADENNISIIGSTIILPLLKRDFTLIENGGLPVEKLTKNQICSAGTALDVLLFDTWVMHNDYQDFERLFFSGSKKHQGYANILPLRHLALFWKPSEKNPLHVYAEPDSLSMLHLLRLIGFENKSTTAIGEPLLYMQYPLAGEPKAENMLDGVRIEEVANKIEECASWPLA